MAIGKPAYRPEGVTAAAPTYTPNEERVEVRMKIQGLRQEGNEFVLDGVLFRPFVGAKTIVDLLAVQNGFTLAEAEDAMDEMVTKLMQLRWAHALASRITEARSND